MMARPTVNTSRKIVFSAWFLTGLCLLLLPHQLTDPCQYLFRRAFQAPLQMGSRIPSLATPRQVAPVENPKLQKRIKELEEDNKRLINHNKTLLEDLWKRDAWISELSGMRQRSGWDRLFLVGANVVMSLTPEQLILNRGTRDSVRDGFYAMVDNAIIGRVANANIFESQLLLVTHPKSSIPAYIKSVDPDSQVTKRILAKLDGLAGDQMRMNISKEETIHVGDPVHAQIQRGLDIPFLVGFVSNYKEKKEAPWLWEVLVKPATPLNDLREVHVLGLKE